MLMANGLASLMIATRNSMRMFTHLGISGMRGFMQARHGIGEPGKTMLRSHIESGYLEGVPPDAVITKQLSAGFTSSASVEFERGGQAMFAVVLASLDSGSGKLMNTRTFLRSQ